MKMDTNKEVMTKYLVKMLALTPEEEAYIEKQTHEASNDPVHYEFLKQKAKV